MEYVIELVETERMPSLSIRKTVTADHLPHEIGSAYASITSYLADLGIKEPGQPYIAYYNMDMQNLDVEMGFVTNAEYPGYGDINAETIPAGKWVSFIHKGPYKEMGHGYTAATRWMQEHGYHATGIVYEYYLNSLEAVPESELVTKVEFLLQA
ncbi:MAG: GyrI-like domain-containing protein [Sphaerochaeta sp.]|nr:GyrI-like domain-containing protein [Sphaerochaeta sp.]